jgi:hypothetical protein
MKSVYIAVWTGPLNKAVCAFYNPNEKCLQRGMDWVFKYSGLRFVFKGLKIRFL